MSDADAIELRGLTRRYGDLVAVDGIDLAIGEGSFFGLLGPNGAGKTTIVSVLCTLLRPSSGGARLLGRDVVADRAAVRRQIGIVFQEPSLDPELTGRQNLDLHARLYHLDDRRRRIGDELERMELDLHADRPVRQLSGGLKRRLEIARGLLHEPRVLFLDEPTLGLDVPARRALWSRLDRLREMGALTVVLTTHDMHEAARLCDRVGILNQGRLSALGTPRELCQAVGGDHVEFEVERSAEAAEELRRCAAVVGARADGTRIEVTVRDAASALVGLIEEVRPFGIHAVRMREATLEDAFLHFTGRTIGPEGELR